MHRVFAIVERDLRRFKRSPTLILVSMIFPMVQLIVLGYAFGGNLRELKLGVVDQDHGIQAVKLEEMFESVTANARTFQMIRYADPQVAMTDLRNGRINGLVEIPPDFSRNVYQQVDPQVALIEDNTDNFVASTLQGTLSSLMQAYNQKGPAPRLVTSAALSVVEVYPYVPYIQYLLPGSVVLSIFMMVMIGGGIIYIDDKARGLHEGYLVTPVTKFELIAGFNLAGSLKAMLAGMVLVAVGSLIAGIPHPLDPMRLMRLFVVVVATSLALICMMFLFMVRVSDPLVPRATFGVLNTLLFFPSGAVYPVQAFPKWMQTISTVDPFTYAVHACKSIVLKNTGLGAVAGDLAYLALFALVTMMAATVLFKRTL